MNKYHLKDKFRPNHESFNPIIYIITDVAVSLYLEPVYEITRSTSGEHEYIGEEALDKLYTKI